MNQEIVVEDVNRALQADDLPRAIDLAQRAVTDGLRHPLLFNLAAHGLELRHDYDGAIALLERGLALAPDDVDMLTALGLCQNKLGRAPQAQAAFDAVLSARPDFAPAHHGKGAALERLGDLDGARRHHGTAMHLMPGYADPIGSLASLAARAGDTENARALATKALAIDPSQVNARVVMAGLMLGERDFAGAEAASRALIANPSIDPLDRALCEIMQGDALDGQARIDEAFDAYVRGNADFRRVHASQYEGPGVESYVDFARRLGDWFEKLPVSEWRPQGASEGPARAHVFLLGFFRSGTTLLENVLAGHPDVVALDERDTLRSAMAEFLADDAGLNRLAALTPELADAQREAYWRRVREFGVDPAGKVFVDKMPIYTSHLALINALFPHAKILFAVRDPRDVVLSCFRRGFQINSATFQLTTLEDTARLYEAVMRLGVLFRERLSFDLMEVRYEALVEDFAARAGEIAHFLDLEWDDKMRAFAETAQGRTVRTPSGKQLVRGLYSGAGQWKPYARHLERVLPILQPWIERFGYDNN